MSQDGDEGAAEVEESAADDRGRFVPENLITRERFVEAALAGRKDQVRRNDQYAHEGETFTLEGVTFEVVDVTEQRLGDVSDADARREGFPDLETYRELIERVHEDAEGGTGWNASNTVVVHTFARVEE